jgi:WXG100 family type VII secretion target
MFDEVKADYDRLEQVANRFANSGQVVQQLLQNVKGSMDPLEGGGWVGRGSDAFFEEMNSEVLPASQRLQQAMEEANRVTRQIIQTMKQAEEEACSPFRTR